MKLIPAAEHQTYVAETQELVNRIAQHMNVEPLGVSVPQNGFLEEPLTSGERAAFDETLGEELARENVALQDRIAQVPIDESGERMVPLEETFAVHGLKAFFSDKPFHQACGEWGGKPRVFWTREEVAARLGHAIGGLNAVGLTLTFQDAFRPVGVQEGLFQRRITDFILPQHPDWSWERILDEARSKTAISPVIAGHKGGASVDATLSTIEGEPLPLGHEYPEGGALVALEFPYLTKEQWRTRQIFAATMRMAGFTVYPGEDWHASYGDNLAVRNPDVIAQYGPLKGFDPATGAVQPYDPSEYHQPFYTEDELRQIVAQRAS